MLDVDSERDGNKKIDSILSVKFVLSLVCMDERGVDPNKTKKKKSGLVPDVGLVR